MEHIVVVYEPTKILNDVIVFDDEDNVLENVQVLFEDIEETIKTFKKIYEGADVTWQS